MARKSLSDFNYDHQAYANYLESAECANDDGYDIYADHKGNIYERTDGDWTKGHGHRNDSTNYDRDKNSDKSRGRSWKNPWLKYSNKLNLTQEEVELLNILYNHRENAQTLKKEKSKTLTKRR